MTKSLVIISSCLSWTWLELNKTSLNRYIRFFPYGFSSLVSCDHLVKPSTHCAPSIAPARVCLDREEHHGTIAPHTLSHLARPPRRLLRQPTKGQPTATAWHTQVAGHGGTYDMTFPYQIPVIACWLHTPGEEYMVIGLKMIWWFDVCFFWRQKGWIQQLKASSVATEYWDRLQGSVWGYKLASLEIVGFIAF